MARNPSGDKTQKKSAALKDILPKRGRTAGLLALAIGVMVYLASMAMAGGMAITITTQSWKVDLNETLTIKIDQLEGRNEEADMAAVLEILKTVPGVASARPVTNREMTDLLAPWLGENINFKDLGLPLLIDVERDKRYSVDSERLKQQLIEVAPGAQLDDHGIWRTALEALALTIQIIAFGVVTLIILATVAVVIFATKADLAAHNETVQVLHLVGARDKYIAGEFQRYFLKIGIRGGIFGFTLSSGTLIGFSYLADIIDQAFLTALAPGLLSYLILLPAPLLVAVVAMTTAKATVLQTLSKMM